MTDPTQGDAGARVGIWSGPHESLQWRVENDAIYVCKPEIDGGWQVDRIIAIIPVAALRAALAPEARHDD